MRNAWDLFAILFGMSWICIADVSADTVSNETAKARQLVHQGNLQGALQAYTKAARADRQNQQLLQQALLVRRAATLHQSARRETNPTRWGQMAQALRSFYNSQGAYDQAAVWDQQIHAKFNNARTAAQLAETHLATQRSADAVKVLAALGKHQATVTTQSLLAVALVREGNLEQAKEVAAAVTLPAKAGPGHFYSAARMHAAIGNSNQAAELLTRCFESVLPSQLSSIKARAKRCPEFAQLLTSSSFVAALETASKVTESKCSGGTSCAGCPMRAKCASSQGK